MKRIRLNKGKFALVDDSMYDLLNSIEWSTSCSKSKKVWYAVRTTRFPHRKQILEFMHWYIIGHPRKGYVADHIDGNGLNNIRANIRLVTHRQNNQNRECHRNGKLVGCYYNKHNKKWISLIRISGKQKYLGGFATEKQAHKAYLKALNSIEISP